eukprot:TRINITY_DN12091_c0_g1_i1.p1 TRINITY_DN12091_c0_g1~~TRINITY_DN12091_c0_g1_i1.p1  ORF type:complete len:1369 (+),score=232.91 TRINITY_DN12091_c0_g1_i1:183-4109(+)
MMLEEKEELLGILRVTVEGKMIHDPGLDFNTKMGSNVPRLGIEVARKRPSNVLTVFFTIALLVFIVETTFFLITHEPRWTCSSLCGGPCTSRTLDASTALSNCNTSEIFYNLNNGTFIVSQARCYQHGITDTHFGFSTTPDCSSINTSIPAANALIPLSGKGNLPYVYAFDAQLDASLQRCTPEAQTACFYNPKIAAWQALTCAPMMHLPPQGNMSQYQYFDLSRVVDERDSIRQQARLAYGDWAERTQGTTCTTAQGVNRGQPMLGSTWMSWEVSKRFSVWTRYFVLTAQIKNDYVKTTEATLSGINRTASSSRWSTRNQIIGRTILEDTASLAIDVLITYMDDKVPVYESSFTWPLECNPDDESCTGFPLVELRDTSQTSSSYNGKEATVTVNITAHADLELSWEDVEIFAYSVSAPYTVMEVTVRYILCLVTVGFLFWYVTRIRILGWGNLLPEQVWAALLIFTMILNLNPLFLVVLFDRDLSTGVGKLGYIFENDLSYYVIYVFVASYVGMTQSARTKGETREVAQLMCTWDHNVALSRLSIILNTGLLVLAVLGVIGRYNDGFDYTTRRESGSTTLQHDGATLMAVIAFTYSLYAVYRARTKLRNTHYNSSRRRQLLLRVVHWVTTPVLLSLITSYVLDTFSDHITGQSHDIVISIEDTVLHRRLMPSILMFAYVITIGFIVVPTSPRVRLPHPSWRSSWIAQKWTRPMLERIREHCSPYYFTSFEEELCWLSYQNIEIQEDIMVAAALAIVTCGGAESENNEPFNESPTAHNISENLRQHRQMFKEPVIHPFSLQLAAEMAILSQEVYFNPPLKVLLKTSRLLRKGPTPGCCVMAAAAVLPRTLVARTFANEILEEPDHVDHVLFKYRQDVVDEFESEQARSMDSVSEEPPPMKSRKLSVMIMEGDKPREVTVAYESSPAESDDADRVEMCDLKTEGSTVSSKSTPRRMSMHVPPILRAGIRKWLGNVKDTVAACHDEYRFEANSKGWAQNISRSFMDLNSFGWSLGYLLDRRDNRVMICTKNISEDDSRVPDYDPDSETQQYCPRTPRVGGTKRKAHTVRQSVDFKIISIVFRGTRNTSNVKTDLSIHREIYEEMANRVDEVKWYQENPCVHSGFAKTWMMLKDDVMNALEKEMNKASDANIRVVCTGHSLGGALAVLASYSIRKEYPNLWVSLYNYGTPRVGNTTFCHMFNKHVPDCYRMTHPADPVPEHPPKCSFGVLPARYNHPTNEVRVDTSGNIMINPTNVESLLLDSFPFSLFELFATTETIRYGHSMKAYRTAIQRTANWAGHDHGLQASLDRS